MRKTIKNFARQTIFLKQTTIVVVLVFNYLATTADSLDLIFEILSTDLHIKEIDLKVLASDNYSYGPIIVH